MFEDQQNPSGVKLFLYKNWYFAQCFTTYNLKLQDEIIFPAREFDMDKVKTTLKQFVRDWSSEGEQERKSCYQPVIDKICQLFPTYQKYFEFTKDRPHIMFLFYNFSIEC